MKGVRVPRCPFQVDSLQDTYSVNRVLNAPRPDQEVLKLRRLLALVSLSCGGDTTLHSSLASFRAVSEHRDCDVVTPPHQISFF